MLCITRKTRIHLFKIKNMGLLLIKVHYFRGHQANHGTRKYLRSQSGCKPSLLPCPWPQPSPHAGTGTEAAVLWQGLRSETGADTAPAAHTHLAPAHTLPATAPALVLSYQTSPHSFSPREHQHCKPRALLIPSVPPIPF